MKILVVDDERLLVKGIKFNLENEGYQVECAYDGAAAVELVRTGGFDLVILDLMMPEIDGLEACMRIREFSNIPIIMLTARSEDTDKIIGFECGADDYITKPFSMILLGRRITALLRRCGKGAVSDIMTFGDVTVNFSGYTAKDKNGRIDITPKEIDLLRLLVEHKGLVLTRSQILDDLWGVDCPITDRTVDTYIKNLRKKLGTADYIETIRGVGYRVDKED